MLIVSEKTRYIKMLKIIPIILISSTISIHSEEIIYLDNDYSIEGAQFLEKNKINDSQNTNDILYDLILEELLKEQFDLYHPN